MGWKIYFWALAGLLLIAFFRLFYTGPTMWEIMDLVISTLAIAGLYGFAHRKQLIRKSFWKVWVFVIVSWDIAYNIVLTGLLGVTSQGQVAQELGLSCIGLSLLVLVPMYVALYLYGYRSDSLWTQDGTPTEPAVENLAAGGACPQCGAMNTLSKYHCAACGANLDHSKPRADRGSVARRRRERPGGVTVLAVWLLISGVAALARAWPLIMYLPYVLADIREPGAVLVIAERALSGLGGALSLVTALGLWQMKNWARVLAIAVLCLAILLSLALGSIAGIVLLPVYGYAIYWMVSHSGDFEKSRRASPFRRLSKRAIILMSAVVLVIGSGLCVAAAGPPIRTQLMAPEPCGWSDGILESTGCLHILEASVGRVYHLELSPGGAVLVSRDYRDESQLWDVRTGRLLGTIGTAYGGYGNIMAFAPDSSILAVPWGETQVRLWRINDGKLLHTLHIDEPVSFVDLAVSPDGQTLAVSGRQTVQLWRAVDGSLISTLPDEVGRYPSTVAFSPDGELLAVESGGDIQLWRTKDNTLQSTLPGAERSFEEMVFSPDGSLLAVWDYSKPIYLYRLDTGEIVHTLPSPSHFESPPVFSPDGKLLATMVGDGTAQVWDVNSGELVYSQVVEIHGTRPVRRLAFTSEGLIVAYSSGEFDDTTVWLWRIQEYEAPSEQDG
jgi:WD40 repeat protein